MTERHRGFEVGDIHAPNRILWVHGYTGSPDAFFHTAEMLAQRLNALVSVPLLPGHGTEEHHLSHYSFDELLSSARHFAEQIAAPGKPLAIVGYSFGSYLAVILAKEYNASALVLALTPYVLRFPLWIPDIEKILELRSFWNKELSSEDIRIRAGTFYYPDLPGKSLALIKEGNERMRATLPQMTCPIATVHNSDDPITSPRSGEKILAGSGGNSANERHVLPGGRHALFFRPEHEQEEKILLSFLKKQFEKETAAMREQGGD